MTSYTFDQVAIITFRVYTDAGEDAARAAAQAFVSADMEVTLYDPELSGVPPEDTTYMLTCVSPRGKPVYQEAGEQLYEPLIQGENTR